MLCYCEDTNVIQGIGGKMNKLFLNTKAVGRKICLKNLDKERCIDYTVSASFVLEESF